MTASLPLADLRRLFGDRLQENAPLAPFTSARLGGPADALLTVPTADQLAGDVQQLWKMQLPFQVLGGGSNVLVSDRGVRGLVLLNRARSVRFHSDPPGVWAESGTVFSNLAHRAAARGMAGLEWAASVPGSLGGAIYGNAGAFGGDMAGSLVTAELLSREGRQDWPAERLGYGYRTSLLKRGGLQAVVLSAELRLTASTRADVESRLQEFAERRKRTQPPGASMGSMFKNPPGDHAGRLIEAAGLKGRRCGNVEISQVHANFFVNHGQASAVDVRALIDLARQAVQDQFGITLELEIELIGEW